MRSRFAPDSRLVRRMLVTILLLGLLYAAFVAALIAAGVGAAVAAVALAAVLVTLHLMSDRLVLSAMGAREVTPEQEPELHALVDRLCALADLPKPRVAISPAAEPNAFAAGHTSRNAALCVTQGLLDRLDQRELEGVLAHEVSHLAHRDVALSTAVSVFSTVAGLLSGLALFLGLGGRRRALVPLGLLAALASGVVYLISLVLTRALSRYRELAADRGGALLTQRPSALASALGKIDAAAADGPRVTNALMFAGQRLPDLLDTHPPIPRRQEQLRWLATELGS
ncbi:M48 family metalloprotease [Nonomuraea sp. NPDC050310]|uniref:M48 family metalloprotease n=1 Tax=unclassified Nonomuraea TaxID=2593643 RepID=UPI0033F3F560